MFGCNLELFQSDVDPCFLPAEKDAFVWICTRVCGLHTKLQIELTSRPSVQKLHTVKLPIFSVLLACNSGVLRAVGGILKF